MAAGKTNTEKIEQLQHLTATLSARLDLLDVEMKRIADLQVKGAESAAGHHTKIVVIEEKLLGIAELKTAIASLTALQSDFLLLKKDVESLAKWKDDLKKEKDEIARRFWAFGPNVSAAIITSIISIVGIAVSVTLTLWL